MKKMLINATQKEEVRIALVEDKQLIDLDVEQRKNDNKKSNIYNGVISRVEPSLEACFINYGEQRDGFLPIKDIHPSYYEDLPGTSAKDKLKPGQKLIVQVAREERGNKGAALTTYIAIASTFLVLMPKSPDVEGISRRLSSDEREALRQKLNNIGIKPTEGVIVRTAGTGCSTEELKYDLDILHYIWDMIQEYSDQNPEVGILHHESETIVRVIRDYLTKDVDEIITDSQEAYDKVEHYLKLVRPKSKPVLTLKNTDNVFSCPEYDIESQIALAYEREVKLKSGGSIVIDTTEALTAIDVNSSRSTGNLDIESTAINTNLEAADEIARQLKIRDIGGLIVIDFIDMNSSANQRKVEERMKKACGDDRARTQLAKISKFGLMEVSRQRIRGSIAESVNHKCPRCSGTGFIRDNESIALQILRQAQEEAQRVGKIVKLHILVPNEIAAYLLNEKRDQIAALEQQFNIKVVVVPQANLETPHYQIYRVRKGDSVKDSLSFHLPDYYKEQERTPRKSRIEKTDEKLTQSSAISTENLDKTFEARLEKADFIKEAIAAEEAQNSFFNRAKRAILGFFSRFKKQPVEEEPEEKAVPSKRKRRRNRKDRAKQAAAQEAQAASTQETAATPATSPKADKTQAKANKDAASHGAAASSQAATSPASEDLLNAGRPVAKQIKSGDTVEEVIGGAKKKRRKKDKSALGDIDPKEMKAIADAIAQAEQDQQEAALSKPEIPTPASPAPEEEVKPKLSRRERRQRRAQEMIPEYDYEFSEDQQVESLQNVEPKGKKRKNAEKSEAILAAQRAADRATASLLNGDFASDDFDLDEDFEVAREQEIAKSKAEKAHQAQSGAKVDKSEKLDKEAQTSKADKVEKAEKAEPVSSEPKADLGEQGIKSPKADKADKPAKADVKAEAKVDTKSDLKTDLKADLKAEAQAPKPTVQGVGASPEALEPSLDTPKPEQAEVSKSSKEEVGEASTQASSSVDAESAYDENDACFEVEDLGNDYEDGDYVEPESEEVRNSERKKSRRRRKANIEKKDLFLSRVENKLDSATLESWVSPNNCEELQDEVASPQFFTTPSLMEVVASDGTVDLKERSPYRQVVRPSLPSRKHDVYLGVINSKEFDYNKSVSEIAKAKLLDAPEQVQGEQGQETLGSTEPQVQAQVSSTTLESQAVQVHQAAPTGSDQVSTPQSLEDTKAETANSDSQARSEQSLAPASSVAQEQVEQVRPNFTEGATLVNEADSLGAIHTYPETVEPSSVESSSQVAGQESSLESQSVASTNPLDSQTQALASSTQELETQVQAQPIPPVKKRLGEIDINDPEYGKYRYQVFKARQPCVNYRVDYENVNRIKKRGFKGRIAKVNLRAEEEARASYELERNAKAQAKAGEVKSSSQASAQAQAVKKPEVVKTEVSKSGGEATPQGKTGEPGKVEVNSVSQAQRLEGKPQVQPETSKAEFKTQPQVETKPEVKAEGKPEGKPEVKLENQAEGKAGEKPTQAAANSEVYLKSNDPNAPRIKVLEPTKGTLGEGLATNGQVDSANEFKKVTNLRDLRSANIPEKPVIQLPGFNYMSGDRKPELNNLSASLQSSKAEAMFAPKVQITEPKPQTSNSLAQEENLTNSSESSLDIPLEFTNTSENSPEVPVTQELHQQAASSKDLYLLNPAFADKVEDLELPIFVPEDAQEETSENSQAEAQVEAQTQTQPQTSEQTSQEAQTTSPELSSEKTPESKQPASENLEPVSHDSSSPRVEADEPSSPKVQPTSYAPQAFDNGEAPKETQRPSFPNPVDANLPRPKKENPVGFNPRK